MAEARSAATAARRGTPLSAPASDAHCPLVAGALLHPRHGSQPPAAGATAEPPGIQTFDVALRVGEDGHPDPHRHHVAGPVPEGGPPHAGNRHQGRSYGGGYDSDQVVVDDATRPAYVKVLADKRKPTMIGFLSRAVVYFNGQGVECRRLMSENAPAYGSKAFAKACRNTGAAAHPHQGVHAQNTRQGQEFYPAPLQGVGHCSGLPASREAQPLAAPLFGDL